jgi:3-oxoacyl-(acyl-carrier-protein) synthase
MEAAVCAYAIKHGKVPGSATLKASDVDGECDLDYLPGPGAKDVSDVKVAISINLALGGQATCLVFKKC